MALQPVVDQAVADLAARLNVDPADVRVVEAAAVTWRDGSLGCPRPGMAYTQALVGGYRALLRVDARTFDYHAGADGRPFLCSSPQPPLPSH